MCSGFDGMWLGLPVWSCFHNVADDSGLISGGACTRIEIISHNFSCRWGLLLVAQIGFVLYLLFIPCMP